MVTRHRGGISCHLVIVVAFVIIRRTFVRSPQHGFYFLPPPPRACSRPLAAKAWPGAMDVGPFWFGDFASFYGADDHPPRRDAAEQTSNRYFTKVVRCDTGRPWEVGNALIDILASDELHAKKTFVELLKPIGSSTGRGNKYKFYFLAFCGSSRCRIKFAMHRETNDRRCALRFELRSGDCAALGYLVDLIGRQLQHRKVSGHLKSSALCNRMGQTQCFEARLKPTAFLCRGHAKNLRPGYHGARASFRSPRLPRTENANETKFGRNETFQMTFGRRRSNW